MSAMGFYVAMYHGVLRMGQDVLANYILALIILHGVQYTGLILQLITREETERTDAGERESAMPSEKAKEKSTIPLPTLLLALSKKKTSKTVGSSKLELV